MEITTAPTAMPTTMARPWRANGRDPPKAKGRSAPSLNEVSSSASGTTDDISFGSGILLGIRCIKALRAWLVPYRFNRSKCDALRQLYEAKTPDNRQLWKRACRDNVVSLQKFILLFLALIFGAEICRAQAP